MTTTLRTSGTPSAVSLPTRERHVRISLAVMLDTTPAEHDPVAVTPVKALNAVHGTIVSKDTVYGIVDVSNGSVHRHNVRNVLTYDVYGDEDTFAQIVEGSPVYYDNSATMPANVMLSMSPLNDVGAVNALFGFVVLDADEVASIFPKCLSDAGYSIGCAVLQY